MDRVKLRITTITPISIGSGRELSPYADYVIDNDSVFFIDTKRSVNKIMTKGDKLLEDYIIGVADGLDKNRSTFDLKNFLIGNKIVKDIKEVSSYNCRLIGAETAKLPIRGAIQSPLGEPYIPGSTIKGALKTALMYGWLKTNKQGDELIEDILTKKDYRGRALNFDSLEQKFETYVDKSNNLIRTNTIQQVTDSSFLKQDSKVVVDCYRKMPIRLECISKANSVELEIVLDDYRWRDLAKQANNYAEESLYREFEIIEDQNDLNEYYNYLVDIERELANAPEDTCYLRLGFGKGYYFNSLGIAIYDYVSQEGKESLKDCYEEFINEEFARRDRYGNMQEIELDEFPKTRLYLKNSQVPLGWVKIEKVI